MSMLSKRAPPTEEPKMGSDQEEGSEQTDPRAALTPMLSKRPSAGELGSMSHSKDETEQADPRAALVSMLSKRAPPAGLESTSPLKVETEQADRRAALMSMLSKRAPPSEGPQMAPPKKEEVEQVVNGANKFRSGWSSTPKVPNRVHFIPTGNVSEDTLLLSTAPKALNKVHMLTTRDMEEDELLGYTPMGRFSLSAESKIQVLSDQFDEAQENFRKLLQFFGEDNSMTPEAFFCTINTFVSMFDQTCQELKKKQEAKERKTRIEEKRKLREQGMAAKEVNSK